MTIRLRALACAAVMLASAAAHADDVTVGMYAPGAPFPGTAERVEFVTRLATSIDTDDDGVGKVYARAADFAAAVRKGELELAVVDAAHVAALGVPYAVLATATRAGADEVAWQVVSRGGERRLLDLKGSKALTVPAGGRERDFVFNALLGGELPASFLGALDVSPDTASALAALAVGRADVAILPGGVELPAGITRVAALPEVRQPVLVAFAATSAALRARAVKVATTFAGGDVLGGFVAGGADEVKALARRFARVERRGPMARPLPRLALGELLTGRGLAIPRGDVRALLAPPAPLPPPGE